MGWLRILILAFALVSSVKAGSTAGASVTSGAIDTTGANLLVLSVTYYNVGGAPAISDSKSNTWTPLTLQAGSTQRTRLYYCLNPTVGSGHTFTSANTAGNVYSAITVSAWSGAHASSSYDQENGSGSSSGVTSLAPGSRTPSEDDCLVIASLGFEAANTISVDGGFTIAQQQNYSGGNCFGDAMAYLIQTSAAAANPSFSWSSSSAAAATLATYKAAAGGGGSTYTFTATDSIGISDTALTQVDNYRVFSDSLGPSDTVDRLASAFRVFSDSLGITDDTVRQVDSCRAASDNWGVADTTDRRADGNRDLSDSLGHSDTFDRLANAFRDLQESLGHADTFDRRADAYRDFTDCLIGIATAFELPAVPDDGTGTIDYQDIEEDLRDFMVDGDRILYPLIGTKLYPVEAPETATYPFIIYEIVFRQRDDDQSGENGLVNMLVQFDVQAADYSTVRAIEEAIRFLFHRFHHRLIGTNFIQSAELEDSTDDQTPPTFAEEQGIYHSRLDLNLWYEENMTA